MIVAPQSPITDENGNMTTTMQLWTNQVTDLQIIVGTGTPETFVEAREGMLYMDTAGITGTILYIKKLNDIAGDRKSGWILV